MAKIGYARVSTAGQREDSQLAALGRAGCDKVFTDVGESGAKAERPQLTACLAYLRDNAGDALVITKLDRIGRSLKHLIALSETLAERGIALVVIDQGIDTSTSAGRLYFNIIGAMAQFERDLISERTKAGLAATRARGRNGGRKDSLTPSQAAALVTMYDAKTHSVAQIAEVFKVTRPTVYRYVNLAK